MENNIYEVLDSDTRSVLEGVYKTNGYAECIDSYKQVLKSLYRYDPTGQSFQDTICYIEMCMEYLDRLHMEEVNKV